MEETESAPPPIACGMLVSPAPSDSFAVELPAKALVLIELEIRVLRMGP
jgi:hypothetical protein